ncbi:MAG: hypothetical protein WBG92_25410 [Thiohalocapsa sp.]
MSLPRIRYRVVGQDDYMLTITVDTDGSFAIDSGEYTSHKPTHGTIDEAHRERLKTALDGIGNSRDHPAPDGATGFMADLTVGDGAAVRRYHFWEGALDQEPDLKALVRALEVLG